MPSLDYLRNEIGRMRTQIIRQRKEIRDLERGGHSTKSANELLERMLTRTDGMCAERDGQLKEQKLNVPAPTKPPRGRSSGASDELV
jgi:hypothetical protein